MPRRPQSEFMEAIARLESQNAKLFNLIDKLAEGLAEAQGRIYELELVRRKTIPLKRGKVLNRRVHIHESAAGMTKVVFQDTLELLWVDNDLVKAA